MQTFTALVERDNSGWLGSVPGVLDIKCTGRRLDRVASAVRSSVAAATGLEEAEIEVILSIDDDPLITDVVADFRHYQAMLADAQMEYNASLFRAVRLLGAERLSDRDVSFLLGLSHQRIAQVRVAS